MNWVNFYAWPKWLYPLIIGLIFLMSLSLDWYLDGYNRYSLINILNQQQKQLKIRIASKQQRLKNQPICQQQLQVIENQLTALATKLPKLETVPLVLENVLIAARKSNVKINKFQRLTDINTNFYTQVPVNISLAGNYYNFATFISRLTTLEPLVSITDFRIETTDELGFLAMKISLKLYASNFSDSKVVLTATEYQLADHPASPLPILMQYQPQPYTLTSERTPFKAKSLKIVGTVTLDKQRWNLVLLPDGKIKRIKLLSALTKNANPA